jgi:peptidoglycan/xylan/chitin deacetylase (PgdA/CDA1 family)
MILAGHAYNNFKINKFLILKNKFISATDSNEDFVCNKIFPFTYTFDDGLSNLLFVDKVLADLGNIKFRFFISPLLIEKNLSRDIKFIENKLKMSVKSLLTWDQIGYLVDRGHILGLHGYDHTDLNILSKNQIIDDHQLSIEMLNKRISYKANSFAFPFGRIIIKDKIIKNSQIDIAKKFFSRIYLSDNRIPIFGYNGIYNRRHSEFNNFLTINLLKGFFQKFKNKDFVY